MAERPNYRDLQENCIALGEEVARLKATLARVSDLLHERRHAQAQDVARAALRGDQ